MLRRHPTSALTAILASATVFAGCGGGSDGTESSAPFEPRASLEAIGGTVRTDKPRLVMRVDARPGDENIRSVTVNLPPVFLVDATGIGKICSKRELEEDECAGRQPLGSARVLSPAYDEPLAGPVFAVTEGDELPALVYLLSGPAEVVLRGQVVSKGGRIQGGVDDVPDTALSTFELTVDGGKRGYLILSRNICRKTAVADGVFTSQGGQTHEQKIPIEAGCGA